MLTDGVNNTLVKLFGRSWRTTASSVVAAAALFVHSNTDMVSNEWVKRISGFAVGGGLLSLGINCRDKQTSDPNGDS